MNISKKYDEEEYGYSGSIEAYSVETKKENLKNFLNSQANDDGRIYDILKNLVDDILIIKNINIDEEFQGQGFGSDVLSNTLNEANAQSAILICDITESQKAGFNLEKFYESHDFKTVSSYLDYPLMVFPLDLAEKVENLLNIKDIKKLKF
jgi:predicted GNAT family acetyltransferase